MTGHRVVLASAGTGKTFQLTNRFIRLIASGVDPSAILATTFTRKAAGEILQRILSRLAAAATDPKALAELRTFVHPELTHERCRQLVAQLASTVHRLNIKTLDSFFAWITGCFGLEMGIAPGWRIVSEEEDATLRAEAIQRALREADREQLIGFIDMLSGGLSARAVNSAVESAVNSAYSAWVETAAHPDAWAAFGPDTEPLDDAALTRAIRALAAVEIPTTRAGAPNKRFQSAIENNLAAARAGDWPLFLDKGLASCILQQKLEYHNTPIPDENIRAYTPLVEHARAVLLYKFLERNLATRELMARFDKAYQAAKERTGALRFDDIPRRLLKEPLDGRLHHLYYRLDARLNHILLDEFQDTSLQQFDLIEPILDELLADADGSVFIVGDVKQSLYSWRGAEPELLPNLPQRWAQLAPDTLDLNFRSSPIILDTVNDVFENLSTNAALGDHPELTAIWSERYHRHSAAKKDMAGIARLTIAPAAPSATGDSPSKDDQTRTTLAFAADRVQELLRQQPRARVGILVRANRWIPQIIFNLQQRGIAASEEGGNPLTDSPPVAAAMSLLQLADHPGDTAARFHIATSPFAPLFDLASPEAWRDDRVARRIAGDIRRRLMREGYAGFLRRLFLRAAPAMDVRGSARFEQLIDLAQEFDAAAGARPSEFLRIVRQRKVQDPGRQSVSVMTIHQAKGLEFDIVVLPELDKSWQLKADGILTDRRDSTGNRSPFAPVTIATRYPSKEHCNLHPGLAELHRHWQQRQIGEELCCLYVALTRAVHVLEMIVPPPRPREPRLSAAAILKQALAPGGGAPGETVWERKITGDISWAAQIEAERKRAAARPAADHEPVEIQLAVPAAIPLGRLRRRTPSSLESSGGGPGGTGEADTIDLAQIWAAPGDFARDRGSLMHAWFESIGWFDDGPPNREQLLALAPALGFDDAAAANLYVEFTATLTADTARALSRAHYKDRPADTLTVRREWPFIVRDTDPHTAKDYLLSGQFDRVIIGMRNGTPAWADIIDFKTDRLIAGDTAQLAARIETYRPQIAAYRRALAQLLRLPPAAITARLLFTTINHSAPLDA